MHCNAKYVKKTIRNVYLELKEESGNVTMKKINVTPGFNVTVSEVSL
jgi:hypothetical protein